MLSTTKVTALALRVIVLSTPPLAERIGTMACRPFAPLPGAMVKLRELPFHASAPNEELLRASSQSNIWRLETMGTPRASADATTASATDDWAISVCALTV